jgi:hypothetical protein
LLLLETLLYKNTTNAMQHQPEAGTG